MVTAIASLEGGRLFTGGFCCAIFGALLTTALIYVPTDAFWTKLLDLDRQKLAELTHFVQQLGPQVAEARRLHEQAHEAWQRALAAFQSRLNQLLLCDWRCLRGIPFEEFLKELFELHGYHVEATKASGDQGVDLLVTYGAERIAAQVRSLPHGSVSRSPAQPCTRLS
jgi:restriction endonuclease Mrr